MKIACSKMSALESLQEQQRLLTAHRIKLITDKTIAVPVKITWQAYQKSLQSQNVTLAVTDAGTKRTGPMVDTSDSAPEPATKVVNRNK